MQTDGRPGAATPSTPALYVYYRVEDAGRADCVAAVRSAQAALMRRHPGLLAAVLAKVPDRTTLMETYAWSPPPATPAPTTAPTAAPDWAALEAEVGAQLARWIVGARHVEVFEPCA